MPGYRPLRFGIGAGLPPLPGPTPREEEEEIPSLEIDQYARLRPREDRLPTDPSTVLHDLEESSEYTQSIAELYREMSAGGRAPTTQEVVTELRRRQAGEEEERPTWQPIDPKATIEQLRENLLQGRAEAEPDNLMEQIARHHEEAARKAEANGRPRAAMNHSYLAAAARGDVGFAAPIGYLGELVETFTARVLETQVGQRFRPDAWRGLEPDFETATPKELAEASELLKRQEQEAEEEPISRRLVNALVSNFVKPGRRRYAPGELPVPQQAGDVRPYLRARFGETDRVELAAMWAESIAYSGVDAMVSAGERIVYGEDPMAVIMGHDIDLDNPNDRDYEVYLAFMEAAEARGADREEMAQYVQETGYIPGEAHAAPEFAGSFLLDPLDWVPVGALMGFAGKQSDLRKAFKFWTTKGDDAMDVLKGSDEVAQLTAKVAGNVDAPPGPIRKFIDAINPAKRTPEAMATKMREPAIELSSTLIGDIRPGSAEEAKDIIKMLAEEPAALERRLGPIAHSQAVGELKPLFAKVADELDNPNVFKSLQRQRLNVTQFADELARVVTTAADELNGVKPATRAIMKVDDAPPSLPKLLASTPGKLADAHRSMMRDYAMSLNPGYVIRNTLSDHSTMAWDGLLSFHSYEHNRDFVMEIATQTGRTRGLTEAGPVAGQTGGLAGVPILGDVVQAGRRTITTGEAPVPSGITKRLPEDLQKVLQKPTLFGEETRYINGFAEAWRKADAQYQKAWQWSDEIVDTLGETNARRLKGLMADTRNGQMRDLVMSEFLSGKLRRFGVDDWLPEGSELSPAMKADLNQRLGDALGMGDEAASRERLRQIISDAREDVLRHADQTIASGVTPPMRKAFTDMEHDQDVGELAQSSAAMARQMGVDPQTAVRDTEQLAEAARDANTVAVDAELAAMRKVREAELGEAASRAVMMDVRTALEDQRQATRAQVDKWRHDTWDADYATAEEATRAWAKYKTEASNAWDGLRQQAREALRWQDEVVNRLAEGERIEDVLPNYKTTLQKATERYATLYRQLADQDEALRLASADRLTTFEKNLQLHRLANDTASDWAWRMAIENPTVDATDILYSAERDVDELARASRAAHDAAYVKWKVDKELDYPGYLKAVDEAWAPFWDQTPHRWMLAASEIADAQGLDRVMAPQAFQKIADEAGVDIGDLAAIGYDGWQRMRDRASRLVAATQNEIMRKTGLREAQWGSQLDDMLFPMDVEDIAHFYGFEDVTAMGADDWRRVADLAAEQTHKLELVATEVGRQSKVAQVSGRQPEWGTGAFAEEMVTAGALSRTQEREMLQQLTREARKQEAGMVDWLLKEAGYNANDLADLNLQQRERLLQELGQGDLLRQASGDPSTIGPVAAARRETIIERMPQPVRDIVEEHFAASASDPLMAARNRWEKLGEQAVEWADLVEHGAGPTERVPQRFYHGDGWPVLRYDREEVKALLATAEPLYRQRDEYEKVRKLAQQRADAWSRTDFDRATRYTSTNWMAASSEQVIAANRSAGMDGNAARPRAADMALAAERSQLDALDALEQNLGEEWSDILDAQGTKYTNEELAKIRRWYSDEFIPEYNARLLTVTEAARNTTNFAMLDYSDRRNFDTWISTFVPYHFWYTRTARNWAARFAAHPGRLMDYYRYKKWTRQANEARGLPSRLEGMVGIDAPEQLPDWMGDKLYVDPMRHVWPFESLMNPYDFENPLESENGIDAVYRMARTLGMRPFPAIEIPLIINGVIEKDPQELYNMLPQTAPIQAVTAIARRYGAERIQPGGIYIEAWFRRVLGLPEGEPAMPYRVERQQVAMELDRLAQGDPSRLDYTMQAMELMHNVANNRIRLIEALGVEPGLLTKKTPGTYVSERVRRLAEENGWTEEELKVAQQMLAEATQRAALERAVTVTSGQTGFPVYAYTPGEERARALQQQDQAQRYSPLTGLGSREQWQQFRQTRPEAYLRSQTFEVLPGQEQDEFGPEETRDMLAYNTAREQVEQQYVQEIDEYIRRNPWDSQGAGALRQQQTAELAALRQRHMGEGEEYDEGKLWSVYGATPEERTKRRREQVLSVVSSNAPGFEAYTDPETGEVDYEAWEKAQEGYYRDIVERLTDHPLIASLAQEAGATNVEEFAREVLGRVSEEDVEAYRRRNDTPMEAAQRTWNELYSMAWEAYSKAVEDGEDKGQAYRIYIEGLPEMSGPQLIEAIKKEYPGRDWTDTELREALAGVSFPSGDEVHMLRKPQVEQELDRARDEFYQWYSWHVPPGEFEYEMRDAIPLLNAIKDFSTREALDESGFTAEQYREALNMIQEYVKENWGEETISGEMAQEYTFARGLNRIFVRFRENKFPGMSDLLAFRAHKWGGNRYLTKQERAERDAFDEAHPEIEAYRDWEKAYAQEHPVWAKYYKPWLLEEDEEGEGEGEGEGKGEGKGGGRGWGYYYGGGGRSPISTWADFASMIDMDTMTALFRLWSEEKALPGSAKAALTELYERYGWGEFDEWLAWVQRLYAKSFEGYARQTPRAQYTHWIPGVWRT